MPCRLRTAGDCTPQPGPERARCHARRRYANSVADKIIVSPRSTSAVIGWILALISLGACPNSRCSILSESDSSLSYEQVFSPLEYRSDTAAAAECAGLRAERPCLAVYR